MVEALNLILIRKCKDLLESSPDDERVERWLREDDNYSRLQTECEKILSFFISNPDYNVERAFTVLTRRVCSLASASFSQ